jgi:NAD-dependent deacetylase
VVTQNIDNLHQDSGIAAADVVELHGNTTYATCLDCNARYELPWDLNDESGHGVGDGPYLARLTVTYADGSVQETKGAVVVVK